MPLKLLQYMDQKIKLKHAENYMYDRGRFIVENIFIVLYLCHLKTCEILGLKIFLKGEKRCVYIAIEIRVNNKKGYYFFLGGGVTFILNCSYDLYTNFDI